MVIQKMVLKNFKMFKEETIVFTENTVIVGDNGTGKSSVADAFFWVFFGKSSTGIADIAFPKPILNNEVQHNLETSVSVTIDGVEYVRYLNEKYTKKVFTGHTSSFEIDGLPKKKKDFDVVVSELFGDSSMFRALSGIYEIARMKWQDRRAMLVSDNNDIPSLTEEIDKLKHARKKTKEKMKELPARIDELHNSLSGLSLDTEREDITHHELDVVQGRLSEVRNGGANADINNEMQKLVAQKNALEFELHGVLMDQKHDINKRADAVALRMSESKRGFEESASLVRSEIASLNSLCGIKQNELDSIVRQRVAENEAIVKLREDHRNLASQTFQHENANCPTCSQPLTEDMLKESEQNFNLNKSKSLEINNSRGKDVAGRIKQLDSSSESISAEIEEILSKLESLKEQEKSSVAPDTGDLMREFDEIRSEKPRGDKELSKKIAVVNGKIEDLEKSKGTGDTNDIEAELLREIDGLKEQLKEYQDHNATARLDVCTNERIKELREELSESGKTLVSIEAQIAENEDRIMQLIDSIEEDLNKRFRITKWKLFETQVNGGITPCCTPIVNGIPYEKLNTASQMNCGIDIINTISKEKGLSYPVFIDNAESNTNIEKCHSQTIELSVMKNESFRAL